MDCKNHSDIEGKFVCSVCGNSFCEDCIVDKENVVCAECKDKQDVSNDILNDIMDSVVINEQAKASFDPTDILSQIEEEISLQQNSKISDDILNDIMSSVVVNEKAKASFDPTELLNSIEAETINTAKSNINFNKETEIYIEEFIGETGETIKDTGEFDVSFDEDFEENITESELFVNSNVNISTTNYTNKENLDSAEVSEEVSEDSTSKNFGEKVSGFSKTAKEKSISASQKAKVKSATIAGGVAAVASSTKEKATSFTSSTKEKMKKAPNDLDDILSKIEKENRQGEYDDLLNKFRTSYGEKQSDDYINDSLPLKINDIIYFLASLIPGMAQFYLGLTSRGTTLFVIGAVFVWILQTPSLFLITAVLSFADAYKLRNIYYRGGNIVDTNEDIIKFIKNKYIIVIIILAFVVNLGI